MLAVVLLVTACLPGPKRRKSHPSDAFLRESFRDHRAVFESLRDRVVAHPDDAEGPEVVARLGIVGANHVDPGRDRVKFLVSTVATSFVTGSQISIVWSRESPGPLVDDTRRAPSQVSTGAHYSRIADDWYIELHWDGLD